MRVPNRKSMTPQTKAVNPEPTHAGQFLFKIFSGRAVLVPDFLMPDQYGLRLPHAGPLSSQIFTSRAVFSQNFSGRTVSWSQISSIQAVLI